MQGKLKYRHVFPEPHKVKYEEVKAAGPSNESGLIKGNGKYITFAWGSTGGGSLAILEYDNPRRLPASIPIIRGHSSAIIDHDLDPFNDNLVATASDDTLVKVWEIPAELKEDITQPVAELKGHSKKVNFVQYHPTTEHVLASASLDGTLKVWDIQKQTDTLTVGGANDGFFSIEWSLNGSQILTSCRDKKVRIGDPRQGQWSLDFSPHEGPKGQKSCWLGDSGNVATVGFSKGFERELKVWDLKNTAQPLQLIRIDQLASTLYPFFDSDLGLLYLGGRGDSTIRFYEYSEGQLSLCSSHTSNIPNKGIGFLPKRCMNVKKNEVAQCLKLTDKTIEYISFIQPRKADTFSDELYPECLSGEPAQSAQDYFDGKNANPKRASMKPEEAKESQPRANLSKLKPTQKAEASAENVEELKNKLEQATSERNKLKADLEAAEKHIQELTSSNSSLKEELEQLRDKVASQ